VVLALVVAWALRAQAPGPGPVPVPVPAELPRDPRGPGTLEMARRLADFVERADPMENRFLNPGRIGSYQRALLQHPSPEEELQTRFLLSGELLQANRLGEALDEVRRVRSLAGSLGMPMIDANDINLSLREALCHLRRGELANCLSNHNADSCLMPLRGGGIYRTRDDSLLARSVLTNLLARHPDNLSARWLLNVAHMTLGEYPDQVPPQWLIPTHVFRSDHDFGRFLDVGPNVGLARTELYGGVAVDDFDGDGLLDVVTSSIGLSDPMRFFHNLGNGRFEERTREVGLEGLTGGLNLVHADYDNDGRPDLFLSVQDGRSLLFHNDGPKPSTATEKARWGFTEVVEAAG